MEDTTQPCHNNNKMALFSHLCVSCLFPFDPNEHELKFLWVEIWGSNANTWVQPVKSAYTHTYTNFMRAEANSKIRLMWERQVGTSQYESISRMSIECSFTVCIVRHNIFMNVPHGECRVSSILFHSPFASQFRLTTDASRTISCLKCWSRCVGKTATTTERKYFALRARFRLTDPELMGRPEIIDFFNPTDSPTAKQISGVEHHLFTVVTESAMPKITSRRSRLNAWRRSVIHAKHLKI